MEYMVKLLGVFNQKGGVGKTTIAALCAEYLALIKGLRVLVVDADMQCNSSDYWVGMEPNATARGGQLPPRHPEYDPDEDTVNERSTIADIFYGKFVMPYSTYLNGKTYGSGLVEVMLGHPRLLEEINNEYSRASGDLDRKVTNRLRDFLHHPSVKDEYDIVIVDTGPSRNPIFRAALRAATHALIPFEPEEKSIQGINAMVQAIASENYGRPNEASSLKIVGLLPNKVRSQTRLHRNFLDEIREKWGSELCPDDVFLPESVDFPERDVKGIQPKSIYQLPARKKSRIQAERVGEFVYEQLFAEGEQTELAVNQVAEG